MKGEGSMGRCRSLRRLFLAAPAFRMKEWALERLGITARFGQ
jgi:hypothetical protein